MPDRPRIAHVGVAVTDLDAALAFYRDVLGLEAHPPEEADGAAIVSLPFGESEVELLAPLRTDSPIAKFLERRGPGIHHICYRVADLDAALASCRAAGYRLVNLDAVVHAQRPKLSPYKLAMRTRLAELLGVSPEQVSVKAKTGEGVGTVGGDDLRAC